MGLIDTFSRYLPSFTVMFPIFRCSPKIIITKLKMNLVKGPTEEILFPKQKADKRGPGQCLSTRIHTTCIWGSLLHDCALKGWDYLDYLHPVILGTGPGHEIPSQESQVTDSGLWGTL